MKHAARLHPLPRRGAAAVEFALIALVFLTLLFGMIECARLMYVYNSLQEVTRRAARAAVVAWVTEKDAIKTYALFNSASLPGGAEISTASVDIVYLNAKGQPADPLPADAGDNLSACGDATREDSCIYAVQVSIGAVKYSPMISLFSFLNVTVPTSSVTMHAESMGFSAY